MARYQLRIRRAIAVDAELLAELGARTFEDSFRADNRPEDMERYLSANFSVPKLKAELSDPLAHFLVAFEKDAAVGYAKLSTANHPECVKGSLPIEIVRIYVEARCIGKGYGSALMEACLEAGRRAGRRTAWLGVWESNRRALAFYRKWKFETVGSQQFVLGRDVQTDLVMARPLE